MQEILKPWYRQGWPWLLIALPGSAVVASFVTFYLAAHQPDSLVADDYYKEGLAINRELSAQQLAHQLQIHATAQLNRRSNTIEVTLTGNLAPLPNQLALRLVHPTLAAQDHRLTLTQLSAGHYSARWPLASDSLPNTQWQIILTDIATNGNRWEISTHVALPQENHWTFSN